MKVSASFSQRSRDRVSMEHNYMKFTIIAWFIHVLFTNKIKFCQKFRKKFISLKQDEFSVLPLDLILKFWKKNLLKSQVGFLEKKENGIQV